MDSITAILSKPFLMGCVVALIAVSAGGFFISDAETILGLVPVNTMIIHSYIWNIVTSQFFEANIFKLILELFAFVYFTRHVVFPSTEQFGFYFVCCLVGSSGVTSFTFFVRYFVTRIEDLIVTPSFGFVGVLITLLLFARQQLKGQNPIESIPSITYHNLPILIISIQFIFLLLGATSLVSDLPFSCFSLLLGWSYLRFFYRYNVDSDVLGDPTEDFTFVAMFPSVSK